MKAANKIFNLVGVTFLYLNYFRRYQVKCGQNVIKSLGEKVESGQSGKYILVMFELISMELDKIQKSYTHQMKDLAFSFQMACLTSLQLS